MLLFTIYYLSYKVVAYIYGHTKSVNMDLFEEGINAITFVSILFFAGI